MTRHASPEPSVLVLGGVSFNSVVYLRTLPGSEPQTIADADFREGTGSTGAGKALTLAKLGVQHRLLAAIGRDRYGEYVQADLESRGVVFEPIHDPAGTERHINLLDPHGGRISIFVNRSSGTIDYDPALLHGHLQQADIIVINIGAYCRDWIDSVHAAKMLANKPVWVDLHDYNGSNPYHQAFVDAATHVQFSASAEIDPQTLMARFIAEGKALAICTDGPRGSRLMTADGLQLERPALTGLQSVDSDGAGDAFFAGYLYGWAMGHAPPACLDMATVCGGHTVTQQGLVFDALNREWLEQQVDALAATR